MMIGLPAMVYPSGSKFSRPDRLPSWKIQTSAPKLAVIESRVMITALTGMTTEPKSRNRISALAMSVRPTAYGARSPCDTRKSWPWAALPPTVGRDAGPRIDRADDRDEAGGLRLRWRERADRVEADRVAADVPREQRVEAGRPLALGQGVQRGHLVGASAARRSSGR